MHTLYRLLTLLLTPLALWRLQRGEHRSGRWRERMGWIKGLPPGQIWIHAASVGEVNAARGLIDALLDRGENILVSTVTVTGAERCRALFGERVTHRYLALDNPFAVRSWLAGLRPRLGLVMETEIWPELFARCRALDIPLLMISARVSEQALHRYRRFGQLFSGALDAIVLAACQTETDARRLISLGLPRQRSIVTGNLKFDLTLSEDLTWQAETLQNQWGGRPAWTAGSTRPGEEEILIAAHRIVQQSLPEVLLILAPRHPGRAAEVAGLLDREGLQWCPFGHTPGPSTSVVLLDRLGVLMDCYAASKVAFVGGSLARLGGHNLLEPAALGLPVLTGPFLDQQAEAASALESNGGLTRVADAQSLGRRLLALFADPAAADRMGRAAQAALQDSRGSLDRTLGAIDPWMANSVRPTIEGAG